MSHNNQVEKIEPTESRAELSDEPEVRSELLEGLFGYRLRRANTTFMTDFMAASADLGMRPVLFAMLAVISENPGINQTSLGRSLRIQRANLVPLINELMTRHLVDRRPHPSDRRAFALHLSREGAALFDEAVRRVRAHEERMLTRFGGEERKLLFELLNRIRSEPI